VFDTIHRDPSKNPSSVNNCPDENNRDKCWWTTTLTSNDIDPNIHKPYTQMNTDTNNPFSYTINSLSSGTNYEVIVRGYLKK